MKKVFFVFLSVCLLFFIGCEEKEVVKKPVKKPIKKVFVLKNFDDNKSITIRRNNTTFKADNGKVTVVDFFATWCAPCIVEAEHLNELYEKYGQDINIVSVSLEKKISRRALSKFKRDNKVKYDINYSKDGFALSKAIGIVRSYPTMFLINKKGKIIEKYVGIVPIEMLEYDIEKTIGQQ